MPRDDGAILAHLNAAGVDYVVIGGWAVIAHGYVRATRDVDVLVADTPAIRCQVTAALAALHATRLDGTMVTGRMAMPDQGWQSSGGRCLAWRCPASTTDSSRCPIGAGAAAPACLAPRRAGSQNAAVRSREVLVTVEHPDGIAAVVREGREVWLTDVVSGGGGTGLDDHRPVIVGLAGDRTLQGGLLPAGAASAQVVDDAGVRHVAAAANGAWAIVLDQACEGRISPVCYRDADGVTVAPPPAKWARAPVLDADEPCPACGATGWDEAHAGDGSRGLRGRRMRPAAFVVCRACGYEHSVGVWYAGTATTDEPTAQEVASMAHDAETRLLREARIALRDVEFAVYAARGWDGRIGGWGSSDDVTSSVTVDHRAPAGEAGPALQVQTDRDRDPYISERSRARSMLFGALHEELEPWPQRSTAGLAIWLHVRERELLRVAAHATAADRVVLVDGNPVIFATVTAGARWAAVARRDDIVIAVTACDVDAGELELATIADPQRVLVADLPGS